MSRGPPRDKMVKQFCLREHSKEMERLVHVPAVLSLSETGISTASP